MLSFVKNLFFVNKPATSSIENSILTNKLNGFLKNSTDINLIKGIRDFTLILALVRRTKAQIEDREFMIAKNGYLSALCETHHTSSMKTIKAIEDATSILLARDELLALKTAIIAEANTHIIYLFLIMEELIQACSRANKMEPQLNHNTSTKNIADINSDNIFERYELALIRLGELRETQLFDEGMAEIINYWLARIENLQMEDQSLREPQEFARGRL